MVVKNKKNDSVRELEIVRAFVCVISKAALNLVDFADSIMVNFSAKYTTILRAEVQDR